MLLKNIILLTSLLLAICLPYNSYTNKKRNSKIAKNPPSIKKTKSDNTGKSLSNKTEGKIDELDYYKEIINFGTSSKRIWLLQEIERKKKLSYYPLLEDILKNEKNEIVIQKGIETTVKLNLKQFAEHIAKYLYSPNNNLQIQVVEALGELEHIKSAQNILALAKESQNKWLVDVSIKALGKMKYKYALPYMYQLFFKNDLVSETKVSILLAIGYMKDPSSIDFLDKILGDTKLSTVQRSYAANALGQIGGQKAILVLQKYKNDNDPKVLSAVITSFKHQKSFEAYNIIYQSLKSDNPSIRFTALNAIAEYKNPESFKILNYILYNDDNFKVRVKAIEVLNKIGGLEVEKLWDKEIISNKTGLKWYIIDSIQFLDKQTAVKILIKAFKDEKKLNFQNKILVKLFEVSQDEAISFIDNKIMIMDDKKSLTLMLYSIAHIYKNLTVKAATPLKKYLHHSNPHVRRYAYHYILLNTTPETLSICIQSLREEDNQEVILYVMQLFREKKIKSSIPMIKSAFLQSKNPIIRKEAENVIRYLDSI